LGFKTIKEGDIMPKKVSGMPVKTIRAMLRSRRTPARLKKAWRKKLRRVM
jgi:hypothetical protein